MWVVDTADGSVALQGRRPSPATRPTRVIVSDGLAKGDIVVTAGVNRLREDQKVRLRRGRPANERTSTCPDWALGTRASSSTSCWSSAIAGMWAYGKLGREEDPPFTIKTMVVKTLWPGATTTETVQQVTDRIEKKLEELPNLDYLKSYTKPGESVRLRDLKDSRACGRRAGSVVSGAQEDRRHQADLAAGHQGPFFNDEFGDTYSLIFALTSDGFSHRELRDYAERCVASCCACPRRCQGRSHRRPGREDLPGVLHPAARRDGARRYHA